MIDDGVTGFLHPPDDVAGMAASGVALLTDNELHQSITRAALGAVLERFCANVIVPQYETFYSQVIDREPVVLTLLD